MIVCNLRPMRGHSPAYLSIEDSATASKNLMEIFGAGRWPSPN